MLQPIHTHVFANGLVLLAEPMRSVESAAFTFRVPAGSAYEPSDRGGLSTLTCEMSMRGAGERDSRLLVNDLDNLGVERDEGAGEAHISFRGATLSKNLYPALAIYADILRRAHLGDDQMDASRSVVLQELSAVEDEPGQKVMLELRRRHYPDPWGRPSEGDREALARMTSDEVRSFYRQRFRPNGCILGVAGRIDWHELQDRVGEFLNDWEPLEDVVLDEREAGPRRAHLDHASSQTQIGIAYASAAYRDPDYYRAAAAVGVLSGGMSSRLFTEVREKRGLCYSVYATHSSLRDRGSVFCYAGTTNERAQQTLEVMLHELVRLGQGIETGELERLKARIKSGLVMQNESSSARSGSIARDWYYLGRPRTLAEVAAEVDRLTRDGINAYLSANPPAGFTIVTLGPQPLEVPIGIL